MISKNFYDKSVPTRNLVTTISGIAVMVINLVVSVLIAAGKVDQEQAAPLTDSLNGLVTIVAQAIGYVSAIILIFKSKDA
jgi:hypothetical protein